MIASICFCSFSISLELYFFPTTYHGNNSIKMDGVTMFRRIRLCYFLFSLQDNYIILHNWFFVIFSFRYIYVSVLFCVLVWFGERVERLKQMLSFLCVGFYLLSFFLYVLFVSSYVYSFWYNIVYNKLISALCRHELVYLIYQIFYICSHSYVFSQYAIIVYTLSVYIRTIWTHAICICVCLRLHAMLCFDGVSLQSMGDVFYKILASHKSVTRRKNRMLMLCFTDTDVVLFFIRFFRRDRIFS